MKQLISSDRASNNVSHSPDLSLGKAECISSHANKLHFLFDEAPLHLKSLFRGAITQSLVYQVP